MPTKPLGRCACGQRATIRGRCPECASLFEASRGTRRERGYDAAYMAERKRWATQVRGGMVTCWRCHKRISPTEPWDLGHSDDRLTIRGPEHQSCNRSAAGRSAHR